MLVKDEIRKVGDSITDIVNELCSQTQQDDRLFLNAPDYLFVSTNLAKKFPDLMESIVVQSYFTHLPGEISKLWNTGSQQITYNEHRNIYIYRIIMLITTIFTILQYLGTAPFLVHRLFIRVIQPFAFGVIVFLWSLIISSPIYIALMCLFIISIICLWVYEYIYGKKRSNRLSPIIVEMDNGLSENKIVNESYLLCEDDDDNAGDYVFNDIDDEELDNQDDDNNDDASDDICDDVSDDTNSSHESTDIENNHNNDAQVGSDHGNFNLENYINVCEIISLSSNTDDKYEINNIMINNRHDNEILENQVNDENDYFNNYDITSSNNDIMSDHCNSCFNDSVMQDMSNDDNDIVTIYMTNSGKSDLSGGSKSISSCFNDSVILEIFNEETTSDLTDQEENNQITIV